MIQLQKERNLTRNSLIIMGTAMVVSLVTTAARGDWPRRIFAPYMYIGTGDNFKLTDCDDAIGLKYYTLAFIIADGANNPAWDGQTPVGRGLYADQIAAIRKRGGDVLCSFGGEAGKEIAVAETDAAALQAKYQAVIDQYRFTWLDFDIEGATLQKNRAASRRRNTALAALQKKNPGLIISFTLPADPGGLSRASRDLLADAKAQGVVVHSVNIMVMYFGAEQLRDGKKESDLCIASAEKAREQTQKIDTGISIGLCPCIGINGSSKEIFGIDDASALKAFADKTDWVCSLSFWSINRDSARKGGQDTSSGTPQHPWDFANAFKSFTTSK
jgi:chitinase